MPSLFNNLMQVSAASQTRLEDFFTEIFAHVLRSHPDFLLAWLNSFRCPPLTELPNTYSVETQVSFNKLEYHQKDSRIDLCVELNGEAGRELVFVESKIGAGEGDDQLQRYTDHLLQRKDCGRRTLVYITRDYDPKDDFKKANTAIQSGVVHFEQWRWYQIYHLMAKLQDDSLIKEARKFMERQNMATNNMFSSIDLLALNHFPVVSKMLDEALGGEVTKAFERVAGTTRNSKSDFLWQFKERGRYIIIANQEEEMWCGLGFWIDSDKPGEFPQLGLQIEVAPSSNVRDTVVKAFSEIANKEQGKWQAFDMTGNKSWSRIFYGVSMRKILPEADHLVALQERFHALIDELEQLKQAYPSLPWNR